MIIEVTDRLMAYNYRNSFMGGLSDISDESYKSSSIDILERLKLVKSNMDLVVSLATWYSIGEEKLFSQMLKVGISSVVKSARTFSGHRTEFGEYLKKEISNAMLKFSKL